MTATPSRRILRYRPAQRFVHWMGAAGFLLMLLSGTVLLWSPLSSLAAGGLTRMMHRVGVLLYILWPILYMILDRAAFRETIKESITFTRDDLQWFKHMWQYARGRTHGLPPQGRVNAGQKLHHIGVVLLSVTVGVSGLILWFGVGTMGVNALSAAAMVHDLSMLALTLLLVGHLYFTFVYDGLSAMTTGYVSEDYARMEHARWVAELPESAFIAGNQAGASAIVPAGDLPADPPAATPESIAEASKPATSTEEGPENAAPTTAAS